MLKRARQFGVDAGGRFQALNDRLHATVHSVSWDDTASSQEEIWFALDLLRCGAVL